MKISTFATAIAAALMATSANAALQGQAEATPCASETKGTPLIRDAREPIKGHAMSKSRGEPIKGQAIIESHDDPVKGHALIESHDDASHEPALAHGTLEQTTPEPWYKDDSGVVHIYGKPTFSRKPTPTPTSPDSAASSAPATTPACGHKGVPMHHKRHWEQSTPAPTKPIPAPTTPTVPTWAPGARQPDSNNAYAMPVPVAESDSGDASGVVGKAYAVETTSTATPASGSSGAVVPLAVGGCVAAVVGAAVFVVAKKRRNAQMQFEDGEMEYASHIATPV